MVLFSLSATVYAFDEHGKKQNKESQITDANFKQDKSSVYAEVFTSMPGQGSSSSNSTDNGDDGSDGSNGSNGESKGSSGGNTIACFKTVKTSSAAGFSEKIYNSMLRDYQYEVDKIGKAQAGNFENRVESLSKSISELDGVAELVRGNLQDGSLIFGGDGEHYTVSKISGDEGWLASTFSYINGDLEDEELEEFRSGSAYMTYPNSDADWGKGSYCGIKPVGVSVYITTKHVVGDPITDDIIKSALYSSVDVQLNKVGEYQYKADVSLNSSGYPPLRAKDITWVWTLRVPDEDNPISGTKTLQEANKSFKNPSSVQNMTTFNINVSGNTGKQSAGEVKSEFCKGFNEVHTAQGSSCSSGKAVVSISHDLYSNQTDKQIKALMGKATDKSAIGGNDASVMNIAKVSKNSNMSDTFDLSSYMDSNGGKYIVAVSVIVNGEYEFNTGDGYLKINMPLGFVSAVAGDTQFSCSQIMNEFENMKGKDLTDMNTFKMFTKFSGSTCQEVSWQGPTAIADIESTPNNQVILNGSRSTGTTKITKTYVFDGKYKEEKECKMVDVDGEQEERCEIKTYADGFDYQVTETTKYFPIETYMWEKEGRVYDKQAGRYEIELPSESFKEPKIYGDLNNGTTYACLRVITTAPSHNASSGTYPNKQYRDTYGKLKGINQIKDEGWLHCDYIRSVENDRVIHENWAN